MRIIAKPRLTRFWESRKGDARIAERDLTAWYTVARRVEWAHFGALKQTFGSADQVGNCIVFDVGNNRFRLIARVNFGAGIIYVLKVMDHAEYDRKLWVDDCGCHEPPPKSSAAKEASSQGRPPRSGPKGGPPRSGPKRGR